MSKFSKFKSELTKDQYNEMVTPRDGSKSRMMQPGVHEVTIKEIEDRGPAKLDDSWINYKVVFENASGNTMNHFIALPTESELSPKLDGAYPGSTCRKLIQFCNAIGIEATQENIKTVLEDFFEDVTTLVGMRCKITIKFKGPHAARVPTPSGKTEWAIVDVNGTPTNNQTFVDINALEKYIEQNPVPGYKKFSDIVSVNKSDTPNRLPEKKVAKRYIGKVVGA